MNTKATASSGIQIDWKRIMFLMIGIILFSVVYYSPPWPDALDPMGKAFTLSPQGKGAIALFLLAGTWWVFEVVPIGVTGLAIGVVQALFFIRPAADAFKDFMDPSVLFIFGSLIIGTVFTKVGITRRLAYKMLMIVGERTSMIYLGCFVVTALLTHVMAHTAVAATMYPLLLSIYALYTDEEGPTKFGKGLFMGMAFVAGAGSIITLLGAARGIVALGFYEEITGKSVSFFELTYYMFPIGWGMVFILWGFFMVFFKPEKAVIPGLREKAKQLSHEMGPFTRHEIIATGIIFGVILFLSLQSFIPVLKPFNKAAVLLVSTILFFIVGILDIGDLEDVPWNIILLFAGAMSMGFCLWQTGAAEWLAINWLSFFQNAHWFVFVMAIAFFVMVMTNFIMNVAAIAISVPVALVVAPYLGVAAEVIVFAALVTAGMPFLLLVGAAPNAIAYNSGQFTSGEFFGYGIPASILLMALVALAVLLIWPLLGMPILL
ncbi:SLC13 family permease [Desulfotignum phosphitoxidans]|jgi:sodium-dependent dicarboxylate transporter 2/3/5|uniref:Citrate transporter n=1 Tax=Desulfotignum phosphitoxidans DSM 13687 TaxID=1286635 RepID=S0G7C3_9BACT|nr:SLC13 family permease [Desulfotignum phosphitoxidans]EMS80751.1 citrate transporter [Desulfotignum phosphitoxidans DSM 13687]